MFKKFLILFFLLTGFTFGAFALAQPDIGLGTAQGIAQQGGLAAVGVTDTSLAETVGRYIRFLLGFTGAIFLLLIIYAGTLWMFGGGNEENISKAKKIFPSSVIGMAVVLLSYSITALVMHFVVRTTAPKPYGEITPTGPSQYTGCCFKAIPGCEATFGAKEGPASIKVPCGDCWENQGEAKCNEVGGRWFTQTCVKAANDYEFQCKNYISPMGDAH